MSARTDRIATAIDGVRRKMEEKDKQRDELASQLAEKVRELATVAAARDKLQAFVDTPDWGSLDNGDSIKKGDIVRFGALRYAARSGHTKALTRSPLNLIYWEVVTDA